MANAVLVLGASGLFGSQAASAFAAAGWQVRTYQRGTDMARAAVALAERRATLPACADIPFAGYTLTMQDLASAVERLTGARMRLTRFMWWFITLAAPFWELARELSEMRYLYDTAHSLDPAPLAAVLPDVRLTALDTVLRQHLDRLAPALLTAQGTSISTQTGR